MSVKTKDGKNIGTEEKVPESERLQGLRLLAILAQAPSDLDHIVRQITSTCFPTKEQRAIAFIFWYLRFKAKGGISEQRVEEWLKAEEVKTLADSPLLEGLDRGELLKLAKTSLGSANEIPTDPELIRIAIANLYSVRKRNEMRDNLKKLGSLLDKGLTDEAEETCRKLRLLGALDDKEVPVIPAHEGSSLGQLARELEARPEGLQGLATGWREVDDILGGIRPGRFYVLGGASSTGKTSFVVQALDQIAERNPSAKIVIFSLEQEADELRIKSLSRLSQVSVNKLERKRGRDGNITAEEWQRVIEAGDKSAEWRERITILDARLKTERLCAIAEGMAEADKHLIVAVDYLQLVRPEGADGSNIRAELEDTIHQLARLARTAKCAVIGISSLSRNSVEKIEADASKATMQAFKESGMIEYSADVAMILAETDLEKRREADQKGRGLEVSAKREIYLNVLKNRMGRTSSAKFSFFPELAQFQDRDEEVI